MKNPLEQDDLPLTEKLGNALSRVGVAMRADRWESTAEDGLNPTQGQILTLLARRNTGLRLGEIAGELAVSSPTVSDSVAALIEKGLVQKRRALDDARAVAVTLLPAGWKVARRLDSGGPALAHALERLPAEEQQALYRSLLKVIRELQRSGRISVARMCVTCRYFRPQAHQDSLRPHHCALVNAPFGDSSLREDCPDHELADEGLANQNWSRFAR